MIDYDTREAKFRAEMTADERAESDARTKNIELQGHLAQVTYDARTRAGLTLADLAERIGEPVDFVEDIEDSGVTPTIELLDRIARACGERLTFTFTAA
ncbi:helix-turn-helix transcriptional regulator [Gordonia malaquae]|uniref:helix-turn-helix domain-containing protein n=1 Tax=Gordonia malaquae TaxID=410332 RepID=UPI0030FE48CA